MGLERSPKNKEKELINLSGEGITTRSKSVQKNLVEKLNNTDKMTDTEVGNEKFRRLELELSEMRKLMYEMKKEREGLLVENKQMRIENETLRSNNVNSQNDKSIMSDKEESSSTSGIIDKNLIIDQPINHNNGNKKVIDNSINSNFQMSRVHSYESHFTRIDIRMPRFENEKKQNPVEFLQKIENYFRVKGVFGFTRLIVLGESLEGRARGWFEAISVESFDDFKEMFLQEFFSIPIQVRLKTQWSSRKYTSQEGLLVEYLEKQTKDARFIIPRLSEYEIHYTIAQQFPDRVRTALISVDYHSFQSMHHALSQLDLIYADRPNHQYRNPPPHGQQNAHVRQVSVENQSVNKISKGSANARANSASPVSNFKYNFLPDLSRPPPPLPQNVQYHLNK
ncbi:uncharacterized protein LOC122500712 [Leptopilina heterotoma]|uniref:uncharacterized protein LOC122500712 n=1 Tax=Leptopilina heterotoma TaxID=63436 RepID=UPI001CA90439|nr:uncharacterized protein LOC122500712 [Leptopilina heterotoma]